MNVVSAVVDTSWCADTCCTGASCLGTLPNRQTGDTIGCYEGGTGISRRPENPYSAPSTLSGSDMVNPEQHVVPVARIAFLCGIVLAGYGGLGAVLNGIDLLRTRSQGDLQKEIWLVAICVVGAVFCTAAYVFRRHRHSIVLFVLSTTSVVTTVVVMYVEFGRRFFGL